MKRGHRNLTPIERAVLIGTWKTNAVTARIHVLIGQDGIQLVNGAGKIFFVVIGACIEHQVDPESPDLRILRGACNALAEQAEVTKVDEGRRASIISGLQACDRLLAQLSQKALGDTALKLQVLLHARDVRFADFEQLIAKSQAQGTAA
jgi:hypothetical protein